jgi:hypothetical protein
MLLDLKILAEKTKVYMRSKIGKDPIQIQSPSNIIWHLPLYYSPINVSTLPYIMVRMTPNLPNS